MTTEFFIPQAVRLPTSLAEIYIVQDFLNRQDCRWLIKLINRVSLQDSARSKIAQDRTSRAAHLGQIGHPFVAEIDDRICRLMGLDSAKGEPLQGHYYRRGQFFKAHTDYFKPSEMATYGKDQGQRTYTFLVYLNDVDRGGETWFPKLDISVRPVAGTALVWNNRRGGFPNPHTLHQGNAVLKGSKVILTKWFRTNRAPIHFIKEPNEFLRPLTKEGFRIYKIPRPLFHRMTRWYAENETAAVPELIPGRFIASTQRRPASSLLETPTALRTELKAALLPLAQGWCRRRLKSTYAYGMRIYHRGATLQLHRDRIETHVVGAILNIHQETDEDWALEIDDHSYKRHSIVLRPGEMLLYEGAKLLHGRPTPFRGKCFVNHFCHFTLF